METPKAASTLNFGQFGLKAMEPERITARQIEAARRAMTRHMKRAGRVWIRDFPGRASVEEARSKCEWVKVRVLRNIGRLASRPDASCSRLTASRPELAQ